jgi:hypothetical protein
MRGFGVQHPRRPGKLPSVPCGRKATDHSIDLPRQRISNFTNQNMKEVKKSPKKLAAYINRTVGQAMKSPKGIYHRKKLHHLFENACYRKKKTVP